jgi:hypothetical protein
VIYFVRFLLVFALITVPGVSLTLSWSKEEPPATASSAAQPATPMSMASAPDTVRAEQPNQQAGAGNEHNPALRADVRASHRRTEALAQRLQPLTSAEREELRQLVRQLHIPRTRP